MTMIIYDVDETSGGILASMLDHILAEKNRNSYTTGKCQCQEELEKYHDIVPLFVEVLSKKENNMDVVRKLWERNGKVFIVFVTFTAKFVVEIYDVGVSGYRMKPIQLEKIRPIMDQFLECKEEYVVRDTRGNEKLKVPLQKIEYFESKNTTIMLHLVNGQKIRTYGKLGDIEKELKNKNFLRCHQSYLINMDHISGVAEACFVMSSGEIAHIRKKDYKEMKKIFNQYTMMK